KPAAADERELTHGRHSPGIGAPGWVDSATAAMRTGTEVPATFVMPHFADRPQSADWLHEAVGALLAQTDPNWVLVIVDDASPNADARARLLALSREHAGKVTVLLQE